VISRGKVAGVVHAVVLSLAAAAGLAGEARHPDCEPPAPAPTPAPLSADDARKALADHFTQQRPGDPLSFEGLTYACVTRSRSNDMHEVAVFGRDDGGGLRLYIKGEEAAVRLRDAINRLIAEHAQTAALPVRVKGHVKKPGAVPFRAGMTVSDAILGAGGPRDGTGPVRARVVRRVDGKKVAMAVQPTDAVQAGDTIEVSK
jgi:hypothetical protein